MAEIEVGEYGRTNLGKIIRFAWLESSEGKRYEDKVLLINEDILSNNFYYFHRGERIVKHSKQLIELIEVGDIVNDCIVVGFGYECVNGNKEKSILVEGKYTKVNYALLDFDIKTILTKEQFSANCYKVGREDE